MRFGPVVVLADTQSLFYTMADTLLWDVLGNVLAAPASALCGWTGVASLPLSLSGCMLSLGICQGDE